MELRINRITVPGDAIGREAERFAGAADPEGAARRALAVRELLLQRAGAVGLLEAGAARDQVTFASRDDEDEVIARVLDAEVATPSASADECRRYYDARPDRFTAGELVEARHILFAVTTGTPVGALRAEAERTRAELARAPDLFAERAKALSNCPSGQHGGSLGQFGRGEMVPEFDRAVFSTPASGVLPELVATRHGFHVVLIERRIAGRMLPFAEAAPRIAEYLSRRVQERALRQYVEVLAGQAEIEGVDLEIAATPLVQ